MQMNPSISRTRGGRATILSNKIHNQHIKIGTTRIWRKLLFSCGLALLLACGIGYSMKAGLDFLIVKYIDNAESEKNKTDKVMEQFQKYVKSEKISIKDQEKVFSWIDEYRTLDIYFSGKSEIVDMVEEVEQQYEDTIVDVGLFDFGLNAYDIEFSDETIKCYPILFRAEKYYDISFVFSVFIGVCIFVSVLLKMVSKRFGYIVRLSEEMKLVEAGNLECEITVEGNDEIAFLGKCMNEMRKSVIEKMHKENVAILANEELITAISHDIRTPLTKQIGYLEILELNKFSGEKERTEYLTKAKNNAYIMKDITDQLFRYFLAFSKRREQSEWIIIEASDVLNTMLEEQRDYLQAKGFNMNIENFLASFYLRIKNEDFYRIFYNLFSNIEKYADITKPISIRNTIMGNTLILIFHNYKKMDLEKVESTKIGLNIAKNFMQHMSGDMQIVETENEFEVSLKFVLSETKNEEK